jgi:putative transposase
LFCLKANVCDEETEFWSPSSRSLASIKRSYEKAADAELSDSSWYDHAIEHLAQEPNRIIKKKLAKFEDVLIQDSTIIRLHKTLAKACCKE